MILRRISYAAFGAALSLASFAGGAAAQDALRIGTSSSGTAFYAVTVALGEIINKFAGINTTAEPVGGSAANVFGVGAKKIEMGLVNAYAAESGYKGIQDFKGRRVDMRLVLQGQPAYRSLIVRKEINGPSDLTGKTIVGKRRAIPDMEIVADAYVKVLGLKDVKIVGTTDTNEAGDALRAGSVAGAILPFSKGSPQVQRPLQDGIADFMYITPAQAQQIMKMIPEAFFLETFKAGTFPNQTKDQPVFGMNNYLIAQPGLKDETVYKVTKAVLEHIPEFTQYHKQGAQWSIDNTLSEFALPFHPGAIRYFKEVGRWTDTMEARQQKLLAQR